MDTETTRYGSAPQTWKWVNGSDGDGGGEKRRQKSKQNKHRISERPTDDDVHMVVKDTGKQSHKTMSIRGAEWSDES